jgi:exopolyphosphatase/guanosine-5'-triphosphate,3'-diphosphate pyrophosphatase
MRPERVQESDDIYLVSSALNRSVKVRAGQLDIKTLETVNEAGLEQWRPVIKASLPLFPEDTRRVCAVLGIGAPDSAPDSYSLEDLLQELGREGLRVAPVAVHKKRHRFTLRGCMVEVTEVRTEAQESRTLAVESEDPNSVLSLLRELELSQLRNTSYPRWLWTIAGSGA